MRSLFVSLPVFHFNSSSYPFSLHSSVLVFSPPLSVFSHPHMSRASFLQPLVAIILPLLPRAPAVATAAEVPPSWCAAGPTMKMCNVWHSWNESPNRRGSGYHRAPLGPASVCLMLIMAHANECAALKSVGAWLPDSVCGGVVCLSVHVPVFFFFFSRVGLCMCTGCVDHSVSMRLV